MKKKGYTVEELLEVLALKMQKVKSGMIIRKAIYDTISNQKEEIERLREILAATVAGQETLQRHIESRITGDVAEVVRCKDCRHWGGVTFGYVCRRWSETTLRNETTEYDFCSFGTKRNVRVLEGERKP